MKTIQIATLLAVIIPHPSPAPLINRPDEGWVYQKPTGEQRVGELGDPNRLVCATTPLGGGRSICVWWFLVSFIAGIVRLSGRPPIAISTHEIPFAIRVMALVQHSATTGRREEGSGSVNCDGGAT